MLCPSEETIISLNRAIIERYSAKRGDKHTLLSYSKIADVVLQVKTTEGPTHRKAAALMRGIVQAHAFASGNKRTAFFATREFLQKNNAPFAPTDGAQNVRILIGIREGFYSLDDISNWLRTGAIHEFRR